MKHNQHGSTAQSLSIWLAKWPDLVFRRCLLVRIGEMDCDKNTLPKQRYIKMLKALSSKNFSFWVSGPHIVSAYLSSHLECRKSSLFKHLLTNLQ